MISRALLAAARSRRAVFANQHHTYRHNNRQWNSVVATSAASHQQAFASSLASVSLEDDDTLSFSLFQHQQVRWKRKGGASAFKKPRPVPRKKLKAFNRRKKAQHFEKYGRHSPPGSKAAIRREHEKDDWDALLNHDPNDTGFGDPKKLEYDMADALLDDLIGSTPQLTSTPTPEPTYLGHLHKKFYNQVAGKMDIYKQSQQELLTSKESSPADTKLLPTEAQLPSDREISLVLRAYRDRHGTKTKPIGIVKALEHLLRDLNLPVSSFGELTFTTLLTCCRTPKEARRIFKLQKDSQHPISSYSWSILVDIHAKLGDYEGCNRVMEEMVSEGVQPSLAAYTSLLAACYKVCNSSGRVPNSVRSQAGKLAWSKWKELRIIGLEPDVMAYGAMLRICAARGHPERALSLLEEMQTQGVKPTTLCFTSALRATARSHETAVRHERAFSKKNRRREHTTAHHGKLARSILILAENAEVDQDDGFIAALILCAAAAGDSATAKAILLASDVRRMDHLRTIGSDTHLKQLRGEDNLSLSEDSAPQISHHTDTQVPMLQQKSRRDYRPSFADREYGGRDTRALSALLLACSNAAENRGLGDMWAGRENKGYLCDNSLRLITVRPAPKYDEERIPGVSYQELAHSAMVWDEEEPEHMGKRLRRAKFRGVDIDEDAGFTLDELDDSLYHMFANDSNEQVSNADGSDTVDAQELIMGKDTNHDWVDDTTVSFDSATGRISSTSNTGDIPTEQLYFDDDYNDDWIEGTTASFDSATGKISSGDAHGVVPEQSHFDNSSNISFEQDTGLSSVGKKSDHHEPEEEYVFDRTLRKWMTRPKADKSALTVDRHQTSIEQMQHETPYSDGGALDDDEFQLFFEGLKHEVMESGEEVEVLEEDARAFYEETKAKESFKDVSPPPRTLTDSDSQEIDNDEFKLFYEGLKQQVRESGDDMPVKEKDARELFAAMHDEFKEEEDTSQTGIDHLESFNAAKGQSPLSNEEIEFSSFYGSMKREAIEAGDVDAVQEEEARELFDMFNSAFNEEGDQSASLSESDASLSSSLGMGIETKTGEPPHASFDDFLNDLKDEWRAEGVDMGDMDERSNEREIQASHKMTGGFQTSDNELSEQLQPEIRLGNETWIKDKISSAPKSGKRLPEAEAGPIGQPTEAKLNVQTQEGNTSAVAGSAQSKPSLRPGHASLSEIDKELEAALPGMPHSRVVKIRNVFVKSLGDPSMLRLVPLLRENMPDYVTRGWLKRKNLQNASFVMKKAKEDGLIDIHMLNGMLQVETSCGSLDRALSFHQEKFERYNTSANVYSDRLVLQMFVRNNRMPRALAFKQKVEEAGRSIDIHSYGSIIEHYGNKGQLGSALLMLKECIAVHGAPPGDSSLKKVRLLCRQHDVEDQVGIVDLIGKDPVEWIRHGEQNLKREYSYRGRRNVLLARNRMVKI